MAADGEDLSVNLQKEPKTIIIDYGGANAAKPLHVGHLRSAVIGESVKRINTFRWYIKTIGDVHLGDWGLQMGLIIDRVKRQKTGTGHILMIVLPVSIQRKHHLPSVNLEEIYPTRKRQVQRG